MASREFLADQLVRAEGVAEDQKRPYHERAAARVMMRNCRSRLLALRDRDEETAEEARLWSQPLYPGHIGYVERSAQRPRSPDQSKEVASLADVRSGRKRAAYAELVIKAFADAEHADKRELAERRAAVERAGKRRL